ncbi:MAG: hypothetical protein JSV02_02620 [Dehalococcoidia bacterium]|nr:MAG: hypothetical protein JSV02_02620 [Dehalococcoidia bacterium]
MTKKKVIPPEYIPDADCRTIIRDGIEYHEANDAMFTFYRRSMGELSPFFLALRDEKRVLGCRCNRCGLVRVPPFMTRCPDCNFAPTEPVEVEQVGVMNSTPPITYFATSMFQHMAPFGRGRVVLRGADTAMSINVYTTTGILVPGLVRKDTEVKVMFRDNRIGEIIDIFCVPTSELTGEQIEKKGLQESEIDWEAAVEPQLPEADEKGVTAYRETLKELRDIAAQMNQTERARKDIAGWKRSIRVKTTGGQFAMEIDDGQFKIGEKELEVPDFVMVCEDPRTLLDGLAYRGAITDSIITGKLWISKNIEFTTVFKLDRMARSLARAKKA